MWKSSDTSYGALLGDFSGRIGAAVVADDHIGTGLSEQAGSGGAYSAGGAGDDRAFIF